MQLLPFILSPFFFFELPNDRCNDVEFDATLRYLHAHTKTPVEQTNNKLGTIAEK